MRRERKIVTTFIVVIVFQLDFLKFDYSNSIDLKFNSEQSAEFILFYHSMTLHLMGGKTNVSIIKTFSDTHWNDHTNGMLCSEEIFFSLKVEIVLQTMNLD